MPPVVFSGGGGSRPNNQDQGNLLFSGISFFLSLYVPSSGHIKELIKNNGGMIEKSEQHAQIFLTDHVSRKAAQSAPPRAVSYTFIVDSVRKRELEDLDTHLVSAKASIPAKQRTSRAVGSSKSVSVAPRIGRNAFTLQDDNILYTFLHKPGVKLNGNAIYQQIADLYPQHTMHSWRDRWVRIQSKFHPDGPPLPPADFVLPPSVARASASPSPPPIARLPRRPITARSAQREHHEQSPPRQHQQRQSTQQPTPQKMEPKPVALMPRDEQILQRIRDDLMFGEADLHEISENLERDYPFYSPEGWLARIRVFIRAERNKKRKLGTSSFSPPSTARNQRMEALEKDHVKPRKWVRREVQTREEIAETEDEAEQIPRTKGKGRAVVAPDNEDEESTQSRSPTRSPSPEPQNRKKRRQERPVTPDDDLDIKEEIVTPKFGKNQNGTPKSHHRVSAATSVSAIETAQVGSANRNTAAPVQKPASILSEQSAGDRLRQLTTEDDETPSTTSTSNQSDGQPSNKATEQTASSDDLVSNVIKVMNGLPEDTPEEVIDFIRVSINKEIASRRTSSGVPEDPQTKPAEVQSVAQTSRIGSLMKVASSPVYKPPTPSKLQSSMPPPATTPVKVPKWRAERRIDSDTAKTHNVTAGPSSAVIDELTHKMSLSEPRVKYDMCNRCGAKVKHGEMVNHRNGASCVRVPASSPPLRHIARRVQVEEPETVPWGARLFRETFDAVFGSDDVSEASENLITKAAEPRKQLRDGTPLSNQNQRQSPATVARPPSTIISETPMLPKNKQLQPPNTQTPIRSSGNSIVYETSPPQAFPSSMRNDQGHRSHRLASQGSNPGSSRAETLSSPVRSYQRQTISTEEIDVIKVGSAPEAEVDNEEQETDESSENTEDIRVSFQQTKSIVSEEQVEAEAASGRIALSDDEDEDDLVSQLGESKDSSDDEEDLVSQLGKPDSTSQDNDLITQLRTQQALSESEDEQEHAGAMGAQEIDRQIHAEENDYEMRDRAQEETDEEEEDDEEDEGEEEMDSQSRMRRVEEFKREMNEKYGVDEDAVLTALERTSMDRYLAEILLRVMVQYCPERDFEEDFPYPNEPGIFTEEEDDILRGTDENLRARVEEKHGYDLYLARMDYLDYYDGGSGEE